MNIKKDSVDDDDLGRPVLGMLEELLVDVIENSQNERSGLHGYRPLTYAWIDTPLGRMITIADGAGLYLLEFADAPGLERSIHKLKKQAKAYMVAGMTAPLELIQREIDLYFQAALPAFTTPLKCLGTPFQLAVWKAVQDIPMGKTCSYADVARVIGNPTAHRAVANANRVNRLTIIIPCHRVIRADGSLCGYNGRLHRKEWLLQHEVT
jgi:AraC family transcriptional regulator of adaptative response/methylated-DNA-[protein]-cysteine methyltransferase